MPGTLIRRPVAKLGGLLLAAGVGAAACSPAGLPPRIAISISGQLVIQVVDSSQDVGRYPQVALDQNGNPQVTYLLLVHKLKKGEIPQPIVAGTPQAPAVMLAQESKGVWLRQSATPQTTAPAKGDAPELADKNGYFEPGVRAAIALDASGKHHVAYNTPDGLFYTDDTGGNFTVPEKVIGGVTLGASIAVAADGTPWISFYRTSQAPEVAHKQGTKWVVEHVPTGPAGGPQGTPPPLTASSGLTTQIRLRSNGDPVVAFGFGAGTVVATKTAGAWTATPVPNGGGLGVSLVLDKDGDPHVAYYDSTGAVWVAHAAGAGPWSTTRLGTTIPSSGASTPDPRWSTGIGVDDKGTEFVTWADTAGNRIMLANDAAGGAFKAEPIAASVDGSNPSLAVSADGTSLAVAWFDSVNENLEVATSPKGGLAVAYSPPPISPPAAAGVGSGQPPPCSPNGTKLSISAKNIAFSVNCLAAPANTAFTLTFDNQDAPGVPHNVEIFTDSSAATRLGGANGVSDTVTAPGQTTYNVGALKPGSYYFQCDVHTTMNGTFVVTK